MLRLSLNLVFVYLATQHLFHLRLMIYAYLAHFQFLLVLQAILLLPTYAFYKAIVVVEVIVVGGRKIQWEQLQ